MDDRIFYTSIFNVRFHQSQIMMNGIEFNYAFVKTVYHDIRRGKIAASYYKPYLF